MEQSQWKSCETFFLNMRVWRALTIVGGLPFERLIETIIIRQLDVG